MNCRNDQAAVMKAMDELVREDVQIFRGEELVVVAIAVRAGNPLASAAQEMFLQGMNNPKLSTLAAGCVQI